MPLSKLQMLLLQLLAVHRTPNSYVAGATPLNRLGPRYSDDIDIFHDDGARLSEIAQQDAEIISAAGYSLKWIETRSRYRKSALVSVSDESGQVTKLDWAVDSAFRFFPAQKNPLFGYVLHPIDLATNKAAAAADRREPRDIVDLITVHRSILPLGAVVNAAVGRFPGMTPEEMLSEIRRHSTFSANEFESLAVHEPLIMRDLHKTIKSMLEDAERFISALPSDAVGFLFLDDHLPVQPDLSHIDTYQKLAGSLQAPWPSSDEIDRAMFDDYYNSGGNSL